MSAAYLVYVTMAMSLGHPNTIAPVIEARMPSVDECISKADLLNRGSGGTLDPQPAALQKRMYFCLVPRFTN